MAEGFEAKEAECKQYEEIVYDIIKDIRDPEREETLEQLDVVYESGVNVRHIGNDTYIIKVEFTPTVPHCTLATMIGLCIRLKLKNDLPFKHKLDILIKEGTHNTGAQIIKQINDKERVLAALENPNLRDLVEQCIEAQDY